MTDIEDVGRFTARIIADPRTLNRMVFAHGALYTQNQVYDLIEKLSGEKIERKYVCPGGGIYMPSTLLTSAVF